MENYYFLNIILLVQTGQLLRLWMLPEVQTRR